jgi:hypothetical protein
MKKLFLMVALMLGLVSGSFARTVDNYSYTRYYASNFDYSVYKVRDNLAQIKTKEITGNNFSYTCGPTSLLFVRNYFHYRRYGEMENFLQNTYDASSALQRLYSYLGKSYNTTTSLTNLKSISKYKWNWKNVIRVSAGSNVTIEDNINGIINNLKNNIPVIIALNKNYDANPKNSYSKNPVGKFNHIVVVYGYVEFKNGNESALFYFDPYYGGYHYMYESDSYSASMGHKFAYLKVAP